MLTCGKITLNPMTLELRVDGKEVELTPKEFEILVFLLQHKGWVVTRETLLNRIWGEYAYVETRVVDNHVKNLRKALGEAGKQIKTVISKGYKLTE
jgi:DNA-binding response OmpR family regulator